VSNEEYGRSLAADAPPLTDEQVAAAARIYAADDVTASAAA
jgi:hypothetical protein